MKIKATLTAVFALVAVFYLQAQISYTADDFAAIDESYRLSIVNLPVGLDFAATGEDIAWDFSELELNAQEDNAWVDSSDTGYQLSWCFLNGIFFGCPDAFAELTNLAQPNFDGFEVNGFGLTDVVTHYKKTDEVLEARMIGITPDAGGLSIPFAASYTNPDSIYQFPIEFGNTDASSSEYAIDFSEFGVGFAFNSANQRSNTVEGYGSLTTPFGTFEEVLKMKTIIVTENEIIFEENTVPTVDTAVEYKWFSKDFGIPVLTATGNISAIGEVITRVAYIDSVQCVQPQALFVSTPLQIFSDPVTLDAEVTFTNLAQNADTFSWNFGDGNTSTAENPVHTYNCPGAYQVTLTAENSNCSDDEGEPSSLTLPVIVQDSVGIEWDVTEIEGGLSVSLDDAQYQWLDCDVENAPIAGADEQTFFPEASGSYAVSVNTGGCFIGESECFEVIVSSINDPVLSHKVKIYPNPTENELTVEVSDIGGKLRAEVLSPSGQILRTAIISSEVSVIDLNLPTGFYLLKLKDEAGKQTVKKFSVSR